MTVIVSANVTLLKGYLTYLINIFLTFRGVNNKFSIENFLKSRLCFRKRMAVGDAILQRNYK